MLYLVVHIDYEIMEIIQMHFYLSSHLNHFCITSTIKTMNGAVQNAESGNWLYQMNNKFINSNYVRKR